MLIRVAIVEKRRSLSNKLAKCIIDYSMKKVPIAGNELPAADAALVKTQNKTDIEVDIAFYPTVEMLFHAYSNLDIVFFSYSVLESGLDRLHNLFRCNEACIPVAIGEPDSLICRYLAIRPSGHLRSFDDAEAIRTLYDLCVKEAAEETTVLRFNTRQGAHAINIREIVYCQSEQKYIQITTVSGTVFRKIGKLDILAQTLPDFWRIHQSYLINPVFAVGLEMSEAGWELCLTGSLRLPVSRPYRKETEARFQKCLMNV